MQREYGMMVKSQAECIYWVWVLEKPLRLLFFFFFFFSLKKLFIYLYIFFNIVLTWKIVEASKASVLYIYILKNLWYHIIALTNLIKDLRHL